MFLVHHHHWAGSSFKLLSDILLLPPVMEIPQLLFCRISAFVYSNRPKWGTSQGPGCGSKCWWSWLVWVFGTTTSSSTELVLPHPWYKVEPSLLSGGVRSSMSVGSAPDLMVVLSTTIIGSLRDRANSARTWISTYLFAMTAYGSMSHGYHCLYVRWVTAESIQTITDPVVVQPMDITMTTGGNPHIRSPWPWWQHESWIST